MTLEELISATESEDILIQRVKDSINPNPVASTGIHKVYELKEYPDILVKEVNIDMSEKIGYSEEELLTMVIEDHKFASAYLSRYIPQTVFFRTDIGFGERLYLVQNRVKGRDDSEIHPGFINAIKDPGEMKKRFEEFFEDYRRMRNAGAAIEDQFIIDPGEYSIHVVDTNTLRRPCTREQLLPLIQYLGSEPKSYEATDLLLFLQRHFKEARSIKLDDEYTFLEAVNALYNSMYDELMIRIKDKSQFLGVTEALAYLIQSLIYFPPKYFKDNFYTMKIRKKFNLSKPSN